MASETQESHLTGACKTVQSAETRQLQNKVSASISLFKNWIQREGKVIENILKSKNNT